MVDIKWCCKQKNGIRLIEPNSNLAEGYIKMADDALGTMIREKEHSLRFSISACYYSMYYSLYCVMMKIGIKCEIHSCSIKFMEDYLLNFYSKEDLKIINKAFNCRNNIQYYVDKIIQKKDSEFIISKAPMFYSKSKEILSKLNEDDINKIRGILIKYFS